MFISAELFGTKHLMGLVVTLVVIAVMFLVSEKVFKKDTKLTLLVVLGLFYILEILKIGYMWIDKGSFPMNHLPFHLCSLPLYLTPMVVFIKNEKVLKYVLPATVAGLMFGGTVAMLYPVNILGDGSSFFPLSDNFIPLVSFVFHPLMIFTAIYLVFSGRYKMKFFTFINGFPVIIGFMLIAMIANVIFDQDFMLLNRGSGSPFQFLLETSQWLYVGSMIVLGLLGIAIFHSVVYGLAKVTKIDDKEEYAYSDK